MPHVVLDGVRTRYELDGSGPPLLMLSPGGFDATLDKWSSQGIYAEINILEHLKERYTCIVFDRRETGLSGGRVERITWADYALQARGLLDHLQIERAHVLGGCMGVSTAIAFGVMFAKMTQSLTLFWPVGGPHYRIRSSLRFAQHAAFVEQHGLDGVVRLVHERGKSFGADPRGGPWASVIRHDSEFAQAFAEYRVDAYKFVVLGMARTLFDRDTAPGAEPEDLLGLNVPALIVPGHDASHATSAARYLEECLPLADYWDVPVDRQTIDVVPQRLLEFLDHHAF
jgi:pimeloyl-ACP methyl ester carboxylesterase